MYFYYVNNHLLVSMDSMICLSPPGVMFPWSYPTSRDPSAGVSRRETKPALGGFFVFGGDLGVNGDDCGKCHTPYLHLDGVLVLQ